MSDTKELKEQIRMLVREELAEWGKSVLNVKGWSAIKWADESGVDNSIIYRQLLNKGGDVYYWNLLRLAEAADVNLPEERLRKALKKAGLV